MAHFVKFSLVVILIAIAIAACSAEPPRYQGSRKQQQLRQRQPQLQRQQLRRPLRQRAQRVAARQELAAAPTPYPSADELKPEVPFVEEAGVVQPDETYGPPDQTYGPPEVEPTVEQLPSDEAPQEFAPHPDAEEFLPQDEQTSEPADDAALSRFSQQQRRKVQRQQRVRPVSAKVQQQQQRQQKQQLKKRVGAKQRVTVKSDRLVAAAVQPSFVGVAAPTEALVQTPLTVGLPLQQQQYVVVNHPFAYSAQFHAW